MPDLEFRTDIDFVYGQPRELVPGVARIVANNPSPFTYKGTNTYLVGTGTLAVIDPGPDDAAHTAAVLAAIGGRPVSHIVLTHTHHDHIGGLSRLADALPAAKVCGYGRRAVATGVGRTAADGSESGDVDFLPEITLREGDVIPGEGWQMKTLHTPGHAPDHVCLELTGTGVLFSADHVMAWNTSVVAPPEGRMVDYIASLERLVGRGDTLYLPGHGGRLENPERTVRAYLVHRRWREDAVLATIRDGHVRIADIVPILYRGLDPRLVRAASLSVQAHVEHLIERGLVRASGPVAFESELSAA